MARCRRRLAGGSEPGPGEGFSPLEVVQDGRLLRVRVAEFVDLPEAYLWQNRRPEGFLITHLHDGLRAVGDSGLAHELAAGRLTPQARTIQTVNGFTPAQCEAYTSCLSPGVRLVWGPPGTGKTRVLSEAINALARAGKRVLLVSSTNIAVHNALVGVLRHRGHAPGDLVRVGTPHLAEIASNPQVSLAHLVRDRLAKIDQRREELSRQLVALQEDGDRLAAEEEALAGFDPQADARLRALLAATDRIPRLAEQVHTAAAQRDVLQLGAVIPHGLDRSDDPAVRRWLRRDVFAVCGIATAADARANPGCTTLSIQHRFGPDVMGLANTIAYDGQLEPGQSVRARASDEPEIVLTDTDGADDVARVRATSRTGGWWPVGALLARVLADPTTTTVVVKVSVWSPPTVIRPRRPSSRSRPRARPGQSHPELTGALTDALPSPTGEFGRAVLLYGGPRHG